MAKSLSSKVAHLPDAPGIYLFYTPKKELVYVGKATSLRDRVRSYWRRWPPLLSKEGLGAVAVLGGILKGRQTSPDAAKGSVDLPLERGGGQRPIEAFFHEVVDIRYKETNSVLEAVILEALYIKKYQPKYNVLGKDDKSWNYIVITNDEYPRVQTLREHEIQKLSEKEIKKFRNIFGPYPGLNAKETMKILRKIFRYSTCHPPVISTGRRSGEKSSNRNGELDSSSVARESALARNDSQKARPCLYYQMGQCLGVCTGEITPVEYKKQVIRPLSLFLSGKTVAVVKYFEKLMKAESKAQHYEEAARIRNQLSALQRIQDIALVNKSFVESPLKGIAEPGVINFRIEGYDISNLGSTEKVASMVVFDKHGPVKSEYRKFIIKTVVGQSDVDCLKEVLTRRFRHSPVGVQYFEPQQSFATRAQNIVPLCDAWPLPDVILIDGGRPQVNAAKSIVETHSCASLRRTPIVGIAKGPARRRNDIILGTKTPEFITWVSKNKNLLIRVRDEAHRFAISFHRQRRAKRQLAQLSS